MALSDSWVLWKKLTSELVIIEKLMQKGFGAKIFLSVMLSPLMKFLKSEYIVVIFPPSFL